MLPTAFANQEKGQALCPNTLDGDHGPQPNRSSARNVWIFIRTAKEEELTFSHLRGLSIADLEAGMVSTRRIMTLRQANAQDVTTFALWLDELLDEWSRRAGDRFENAFADCPIIPAQRDFRAPLAFNAP